MNSLVTVKTFTSRLEAEVAKGYLEANAVKAFVTADDEGGMYPYPIAPTVSPVRLIVAKKDLKIAADLLAKVK